MFSERLFRTCKSTSPPPFPPPPWDRREEFLSVTVVIDTPAVVTESSLTDAEALEPASTHSCPAQRHRKGSPRIFLLLDAIAQAEGDAGSEGAGNGLTVNSIKPM